MNKIEKVEKIIPHLCTSTESGIYYPNFYITVLIKLIKTCRTSPSSNIKVQKIFIIKKAQRVTNTSSFRGCPTITFGSKRIPSFLI